MKMKKIIAIIIAVLLVLSVAPITAFAEKGPAVDNMAFLSLYYQSETEDYSYDLLTNNNAVAGATYDINTNTLTLKDFNHPELSMSANMMGDDFKLVIDGDCALNIIYIWGWGWGGGLNIQGTGTLTVNEDKTENNAIIMHGEHTDAALNFGKDVKLNLYGKEKVAMIDFSTHSDLATGITFENGQKIPVVSGIQRAMENKYIDTIDVVNYDDTWWRNYGYKVSCATETDPDVVYAANYEEEYDSYYIRRIIKLEDYDAYVEDRSFGKYGILTLTSEEFAKSEYSLVTENLPVKQLYSTEWLEENGRGVEADVLVRESDPGAVYACNYSWTIDREHPDRYYIHRLVWDEDIEFYVPDAEFDDISYDPDEFAASDFSYVINDDLERETVRYLDSYSGIEYYGYSDPIVKNENDPDGVYIAEEYGTDENPVYYVSKLVYNEKRGYYIKDENGENVEPDELEQKGYSFIYAEQPVDCVLEYTQEVNLDTTQLYEDGEGKTYAAVQWSRKVYDYSEDNTKEVLGKEYYVLTENNAVSIDSLSAILEEVEYEGLYSYLIDTDELHYNVGDAPEPKFLLGDADGDGKITISDVTAIQRYTAQLEQLNGAQLAAADVDGDGAVGINDATVLQRFLAEFTVQYPIGQ